MINMLRADFYRMFKGKTLMLCSLFAVGWVFLCSYAQYATVEFRETLSGSEVVIDYWNSFFNYYPVVLPIAIFCTCFAAADFRQETIKVYIAKGISRWKYYFSKLIVGWSATFLFLILAFVMGMLCSKVFYGTVFDSTVSGARLVAYLLCQLLSHAAFATLVISITFWVRNNVGSMVINLFLIFFGYLILHTIEKILGWDGVITAFWAGSSISMADIAYSISSLPLCIVIFVGYLVIFGLISMIHLNQKDVA